MEVEEDEGEKVYKEEVMEIEEVERKREEEMQ